MDELRAVCKCFNETIDNYNKVLHDHQELRKKCDEKLKLEMIQLVAKLDEIASSGRVLLESFHHYGDIIKFPIDIYEDRDDCLIFAFTRELYFIYLNSEENILYKSTLNIDDLPPSCYELLILNKDLVIEKSSAQIKTYYENEIKKIYDNIESENSYYDMLTSSLFPEESNQQ
ncbi:MAG: hypothetical protein E7257_09075 [Lachnospiraceae bacterium]|nr:hypothetical protein [Lachnospiraceae bacterium]